MTYARPLEQRKTERPKVSMTPQFDRLLKKAAAKVDFEYAAYLRALIEWSVVNGAIESIQEEHASKINSTAA
ncbi:hypothetical protein [Pseudomonas nitroreducens]|uniref:hypothetical protein n=1 Tax=Pseudomonas nitroreducens TaxID=46680 RepID=UPI00055C99B8|nr:hypothetical protein [Pseudomonas nitroreducens]MCP1651664.1 hypothetical protein [Pseudomonas nitroreducens]MCP1684471.1 hypothetical protein [Pseudomonas nitroreducens]